MKSWGSTKEKTARVKGGVGGRGGGGRKRTVCFSFVHPLLCIDLKPETDSDFLTGAKICS